MNIDEYTTQLASEEFPKADPYKRRTTMNICSENHPEVVYDERICPLCDEMEDRAGEVADLERQVNDLQKEIDNGKK